jgi:chromosome segregation ATPase
MTNEVNENGHFDTSYDHQNELKLVINNINNNNNASDHLFSQIEAALNTQMNSDLKETLRASLSQHESGLLEERDAIIIELKRSLLELTEKRFRTQTSQEAAGQANLNNRNIQFLLDDKDSRINLLQNELDESHSEISKLKRTITELDHVILSHNNNLYEMQTNNETVLKAKQETFRLLNADLSAKQNLIAEQTETIGNLKNQIKTHDNSISSLEKRLSDKEVDIKIKIAAFEANLHEGGQYFKEMLGEKDQALKRALAELNELKAKVIKSNEERQREPISLDSAVIDNAENDTPEIPIVQLSDTPTQIQKYDRGSESIKALYEHQLDLLKVKIELLEKTCGNYQLGIKEMNKSFGQQQHCDELTSMHTFKELMQQLQKTNVQLETERIDLQVRVQRFKDDGEQLQAEKENLNKKFAASEQTSQRLQSERLQLESQFKQQMEDKCGEAFELSQRLFHLNSLYETSQSDNAQLLQISAHHDQLLADHHQLTQDYAELYAQAGNIVDGNQLLNEQAQSNSLQLSEYETRLTDLTMQIDHLQSCNSNLNTQKINLDMKCQDLQENVDKLTQSLSQVHELKSTRLQAESLSQQVKEMQVELMEKSELCDQLIAAKEFLVENNSKLLTNNMKIQLFIESMGLDESLIEASNYRTVQRVDAQTQTLEIKKEILNQDQEKSELQSIDDMNYQRNSDELRQYEFNFKVLQDENDSLLSQMEELRQASAIKYD